jgi:hypothetical protein
MRAILEFNLPEDDQEFKDYQDGVKCKHFLHRWLQEYRRILDSTEKTGVEVFEDLTEALDKENIEIFD